MFNLPMEYRDLSMIRELLIKHRNESVKGIVKKDADPTTVMEYLNSVRNPFTVVGQCNLILDRIDKIEQEIHNELNKD